MRSVTVAVALASLASTGAAQAHARLVSATPAPNATVATPARIELRFSERVLPKLSGATVAMTARGGAAHAPTAVAGDTIVGADGRTMTVTPRSALVAGRYTVAWHIVSADTHRIAGSYAFAVK